MVCQSWLSVVHRVLFQVEAAADLDNAVVEACAALALADDVLHQVLILKQTPDFRQLL